MDPLVDEKFILTTSAAFMELAYDWLGVSIKREAYGPTDNEGVCFEYCASCQFTGDLEANLYWGMDGYSKLLILPYIARKFAIEDFHEEVAESSLLSFLNQLTGMIASELGEFLENVEAKPPKSLSHKLVSIPTEEYRKYMLIYFLKDESKPSYLGRSYLFLSIKK